MALDEPQEKDQVFEDRGVTFLVAKDLLDQVQPIQVDFVQNPIGSGFRLTSSLKAGGGCSPSCSC